jgi:hypothetical protein
VDYFHRMIEEQIFDKEWFKYLVWEDLQDFIIKKSAKKTNKNQQVQFEDDNDHQKEPLYERAFPVEKEE